MYFHAPCGVVLYFVVSKLYTDKEKKTRQTKLIYMYMIWYLKGI